MTDPIAVEPARFFEFVAGPGLTVVFVSVHRAHTFSPVLGQRLGQEHPEVTLGTIDLDDLIILAGPRALRFLHDGLRACGGPRSLGILPGYWLFRDGQVLAWDPGLPHLEDVDVVARSALLAAVFWGLTRNVDFVGQAVQRATDELIAHRVQASFRQATAEPAAGPARPSASSRPEETSWAYQTLGLARGASDREVHEAWRRRRAEAHPDLAAQDPAEFARRSRLSVDLNRARDIIAEHRGRAGAPAAAQA
jgi:hypothetical protein